MRPDTLWAKLNVTPFGHIVSWHSLIDHSADVAATLMALLEQPTINARLATAGGRARIEPAMCARLGALAFLHDIGKANRRFQNRIHAASPPCGHIDELGWLFSHPHAEAPVDRLRQLLRLDEISEWFGGDDVWDMLCAVFAHHGRPWQPAHLDRFDGWDVRGADDPLAHLAPLADALAQWFAPAFEASPICPDSPPFRHAFAGLLMLADWLGSSEQFFPMANGEGGDRMAEAKRRAHDALVQTGLHVEGHRHTVEAANQPFEALFPFTANPMQTAAGTTAGACVVLEAETGSGKTEAALWRFKTLFAAGKVDGLYFALPTRVAATQMFARVKKFRDNLFPADDRPMVLLAIPGQIAADEAQGRRQLDFKIDWEDTPNEEKQRARWAAEVPKRFLAAQIAVGSIDQALLGAIRTRHAHLRASALLRHLLVVDEVHASDTYMTTLLAGLLKSHLQAGGHALLLSATLGEAARAKLLGVPVEPYDVASARPYPLASWMQDGVANTAPIEAKGVAKSVTLDPQPLMDDAAGIAALAAAAARAGAKVLIVRNTVRGAIATLQALEGPGEDAALLQVEGVVTLHHGRFATADRRLLDAAVQSRLGKDAPPGAAIIIGTQTLEISLDIDADLLITDLCPVDVLLQRIGRLHRHERARPAGFGAPRCVVLTPVTRDLYGVFTGQGHHGLGRVYSDARIIEATWRLIEQHQVWNIPAMNRALVEQATHPERLAVIESELMAVNEIWQKHFMERQGKYYAHIITARDALIKRDRPFEEFSIEKNEPARTRLGEEDIIVTLANMTGPFGAPVGALRIPHFWLDVTALDEPTGILQQAGAVAFRLGMAAFCYDRYGLQKTN